MSFLDFVCINFPRIKGDLVLVMLLSEYCNALIATDLGVMPCEWFVSRSLSIISDIRSREIGGELYDDYLNRFLDVNY